jgi:transcriptional regulator with XRE-family HTH domain
MSMTKLGDYIRERRGDLDMTRADLARELSVHKAQIQRWEDGSYRPRADTMPRLARVLLIDAWELWQLVGDDLEDAP